MIQYELIGFNTFGESECPVVGIDQYGTATNTVNFQMQLVQNTDTSEFCMEFLDDMESIGMLTGEQTEDFVDSSLQWGEIAYLVRHHDNGQVTSEIVKKDLGDRLEMYFKQAKTHIES